MIFVIRSEIYIANGLSTCTIPFLVFYVLTMELFTYLYFNIIYMLSNLVK